MSDRDLDRLLAGKAPPGDEPLQQLAGFLREVKAAFRQPPAESTQNRQLAAIVDAAQLLSGKGEPVARPASKATGPGRQVSGLPKWRRKLVLTQLFSRLWVRVAVATVAAVLASAGLAMAGTLPDPVQGAVADAADQVGVSLDDPGGADDGDADGNATAPADRRDDDAADERDDDAKKADEGAARQRDDGEDDDDGGNQAAAANASPAVVNPVPVSSGTGDVEDNDDNASAQGDDEDADEGDDEDADEAGDTDADDHEDADDGDHEDKDDGEEADDDDHESGEDD